jgi:ATP-binding cassette subfamily B protein
MRTFNTGERITTQDERIDAMLYLYSGNVRLKRTIEGKRVSLGVMEKESSFGENALLTDANWPYDILAEQRCVVFSLPVEKVRRLLPNNPIMADLFKREVGYITLSQRLRGMLGAGKYTPQMFSEILHEFGLKKVRPNHVLFKQGDPDPRLYYIEKGELDLIRHPLQGDPVVLERVGRGQIAGESAALKDLNEQGTHRHTAKAVDEVTVLVIQPEEVEKILTINPTLQERLRLHGKALESRELEEVDVRERAEGVDQRIRLAAGITEEEFRTMEAEEKTTQIKRFPHIKQRDESDCAAACLTMITNFYEKKFSLGQISELSNLSSPHVTPNTIITGAELMGFNASAYALNYDELKRVKLPGIIGWEGYHYTVIYRVTDKEVHLADPAKGIIKLNRKNFEQGWTQAQVPGVETDPGIGVFIGLAPTARFDQLEPPKRPIMHFVGYLWPYKKYFGDALIAALILNLLGLASPLFIQTIVDTVVVHKDVSLLHMMLGGMILVAIFRTATTVSQSMLLAHVTARIDMRLMSEFYRHVLSLPMGFFLTRNKGEILTRFGENAKIRAIIAGSTITVVLSTLMIVIYLIMMWGYSLSLTMWAMFFIPMYVGITLYFTPRIKEIAQKQFLTNSRSQSYLIESLNGIESLKATANEYMARARWEEAFVDNVNMGFQMQKLSLTSNSLNQLVQLGSTVAILFVGAKEVMAGTMTIGELMGFQMLLGLVMNPIFQIVQLWNSSQDVRIAIDRVSDVLNVKPEQPFITTPEAMPPILERAEGRLVFDRVDFSYVSNGKENHVMKEFELIIEPGEHVAFVGASGCGKSTIAKMILGFNLPNPSGGTCRIDGKDIREVELSSLRRNIGVVLQDSFLFGGTVAENIALGDPEPNMVAVKEAARLAGADEFIIKYPLGYQTLVGEKGMGISGGQRQRICIARALYRRPIIMIFDEATSALDNESEARIQENMKTILMGRTSITIAHRLSTIIDSDYICYIHDGKVAEKGRHQELTDPHYLRENNYKGHYYRLAQTQFDLPPLEL